MRFLWSIIFSWLEEKRKCGIFFTLSTGEAGYKISLWVGSGHIFEGILMLGWKDMK